MSVFGKASKAGAWLGRFSKRSAKSSRSLETPWFDVLSQYRAHLGRLEGEFADLERLVGERELPRDVLQAVRHLSRCQEGIGLSETELRERLNRLQDLHILPEHRVQPGVHPEGGEATG
jgi:hypothetical protein